MRKIFLHLLALLCVPAFGQDYWLGHFDNSDGLPSQTIFRIEQDKKGFLWLATDDGLVRYDGNQFNTYYHSSLRNNQIIKLSLSPQGELIFLNIIGQAGYVSPSTKEVVVIQGQDSGDLPTLRDIAVDSDSGLWLSTYARRANLPPLLYRDGFTGKEDLNLLPVGEGFTQFYWRESEKCMYALEASSKYIPYCRLYRIPLAHIRQPEKWEKMHLPTSPRFPWGFGVITELAGEVYTLVHPNLLYKITPQGPQRIYIKGIADSSYFNQLAQTPTGELWLGSHEGAHLLTHISPDTLQIQKTLLGGQQVNCLHVDQEGNVWFGTESNGLYMLSVDRYHKWSEDWLGAGHLPIKDLAQGQGGQVVGMSAKGHLVVIKEGAPHLRPMFSPASYNGFIPGSDGYGILMLNGEGNTQLVHFEGKDMLKAPFTLTDLGCRNTKTAAWHGPFARLGGGRYSAWTDTLGRFSYDTTNQRITAVVADSITGQFWLGGEGGLFTARADSLFQRFQSQSGQSFRYFIQSLALGENQDLYIGTRGNGLWRLRNDSIRYLNTCLNMEVSSFHNMAYHEGVLWAVTEKGVLKIDLDRKRVLPIGAKGKASIGQPYDIMLSEGQVWVSSNSGLYSFNPAQPHTLRSPPLIELVSFSATNKAGHTLHTPILPPSYREVTLSFAGLSFSEPLTYEYRIVGEKNWHPLDVPYLRLSSLSPRTYEVEVVAVRPNGVRSAKPLTVTFSIRLPFWCRPWFVSITVVLILLGGWKLIRTYLNRKVKNTQNRMEIERRIVASQLSALRAQMNPHFIFNCLTSIQQLLLSTNYPSAIEYLGEFARLLRMAFDNSRQEYITLSKELAFLKTYVYLEEKRIQVPIEVDISYSPNLNPDLTYIPGMLIQPLVENAFQHGLLHKVEPGKIEIQLSVLNDKLLSCKVIDNGVGIRNSQKIQKRWKTLGNSSGLGVTRERLSLIGTRTKQDLKLEIQELTDSAGAPTGTLVCLTLPYQIYD